MNKHIAIEEPLTITVSLEAWKSMKAALLRAYKLEQSKYYPNVSILEAYSNALKLAGVKL